MNSFADDNGFVPELNIGDVLENMKAKGVLDKTSSMPNGIYLYNWSGLTKLWFRIDTRKSLQEILKDWEQTTGLNIYKTFNERAEALFVFLKKLLTM